MNGIGHERSHRVCVPRPFASRSGRAGARSLLAVAVAGFACAPAAEQGGGVPEITVSSEPLVSIGEVAGEAPYLFQSIADARLLDDGRIVVADRGASVVRVYDPDGTFLVEMGGEGDGPGELRYISGLWVAPPDTIGVYDSDNLRLTTYRADGSRLSTHTLARPDEFPRAPDLFLGRFRNGDLAAAWTEAGPREPGRSVPDRETIGRFGTDGRFVALLGVIPGLRRMERRPGPFSPFPYASIFGDSVFSTDGMDPAVTVRSGDGLDVDTIPTPGAHIDPADAWSTLESELRMRGDTSTLAMYGDVARSEPVPILGGMLLDDRGRVWVKSYDPRADALPLGGGRRARGGQWWILDRNGRAEAQVTIPDDVVPLQVSGDRLLGLSIDRFDVERVVLHVLHPR